MLEVENDHPVQHPAVLRRAGAQGLILQYLEVQGSNTLDKHFLLTSTLSGLEILNNAIHEEDK